MEQKIQWKVVCSGNVRAGFDKQQVVQNLAQLKINSEQAKKLVSGAPVTVKRDLEQAVAYRLKARLEKLGLEVELKRMPRKVASSNNKLSLEAIEPETPDKPENIGSGRPRGHKPSVKPGEMECPKCRHVQAHSDECTQCGVIISRYKQKIEEIARDSEIDYEDDDGFEEQPSFFETNIGRVAAVIGVCTILFLANAMFDTGGGYQPVGTGPAAKAQTEMALKIARLDSPTPAKLSRLMESGRFSEVESILRDLEDKTRWDIIWETPYQMTVDAFSPENNFSLESLDSWVEERQTAWAYLARASYYVSSAGIARGDRLARYTSESQFSNYRKLQRKAYQDLKRAKEKNATLLPVYTLLLQVSDTQGADFSIKDVLDEATSVNPAGFYYRYQYLRNLMPKWGGSKRQMAGFVDATRQYHSLNPRLTLLQGYGIGDEAFAAMKREDYDTCISLYSEALQFGANAGWLRYRANCLTRIGEYDKALEDVTLSLQIFENDFARDLHAWLQGRV